MSDTDLALALKSADFVVVAAGAGMSVDCGLLAYAQADKHELLVRENVSYRDAASTNTLARNPLLYWRWTKACVDAYESAAPHDGYEALLRLANEMDKRDDAESILASLRSLMRQRAVRTLPDNDRDLLASRLFVASTNVDSMFRRAGIVSSALFELHGAYRRFQCSGLRSEADRASTPLPLFGSPCSDQTWPLDGEMRAAIDRAAGGGAVPLCRHCGKCPARPAIYHFGDSQFRNDVDGEARFMALQSALAASQLEHVVLLEIGVGQRLPRLRRAFADLRSALGERCKHFRVNPQSESTERDVVVVPRGAKDTLVAAIAKD